jgi:hypothetical protein
LWDLIVDVDQICEFLRKGQKRREPRFEMSEISDTIDLIDDFAYSAMVVKEMEQDRRVVIEDDVISNASIEFGACLTVFCWKGRGGWSGGDVFVFFKWFDLEEI